jgi:hypothetical protein
MIIILLWRVDDDEEEEEEGDSGVLCSCAEYRIIYFPECTAFISKDQGVPLLSITAQKTCILIH